MTSRVNIPGVAPTPMIAVGFSAFTAPRKSATGACSCAYGFLCSASPLRLATTSPFESTIQQRPFAALASSPSSTIAAASRSEMPVAASPAPRQRNVWSDIRWPVMRSAEKMPATVTEAVPWMSSLKQHTLSRYLRSRRNAL